ncbi:hypothetical protein ACFW04_007954 [Cataglyphis niger]
MPAALVVVVVVVVVVVAIVVVVVEAAFPVMRGSVYLAVYKRASPRYLQVYSTDYLLSYLPARREGYEAFGVEDCCHGYKAYTELSTDKRIRRFRRNYV